MTNKNTDERFEIRAQINSMEMFCEVRGTGKPLLMLHGGTGCHSDWAHAGCDQFAERYKLILPDARGHGSSTNPSGELSHRQLAADALALLDHLGIERCRASRGQYGWQYAAAHGDNAAGKD